MLNKYDDSRINTMSLEQQANYVGFLHSIKDLPYDKFMETVKELVWQNIKLRETCNSYAEEIAMLTNYDPRIEDAPDVNELDFEGVDW